MYTCLLHPPLCPSRAVISRFRTCNLCFVISFLCRPLISPPFPFLVPLLLSYQDRTWTWIKTTVSLLCFVFVYLASCVDGLCVRVPGRGPKGSHCFSHNIPLSHARKQQCGMHANYIRWAVLRYSTGYYAATGLHIPRICDQINCIVNRGEVQQFALPPTSGRCLKTSAPVDD